MLKTFGILMSVNRKIAAATDRAADYCSASGNQQHLHRVLQPTVGTNSQYMVGTWELVAGTTCKEYSPQSFRYASVVSSMSANCITQSATTALRHTGSTVSHWCHTGCLSVTLTASSLSLYTDTLRCPSHSHCTTASLYGSLRCF